MLHLLDIFFLFFHSTLIVFNLFGWIWKPLRFINLITLGLTGGSWFILGIFYGIGYCPLTDWHWQVIEKLGKGPVPSSYISYLVERIFAIRLPGVLVDKITFLCYFIALLFSLFFNIRDRMICRKVA